jgi:hypothetical protein
MTFSGHPATSWTPAQPSEPGLTLEHLALSPIVVAEADYRNAMLEEFLRRLEIFRV